MGIEARGNGQYYYRKKRVGNRVISTYGGTGYGATLMQALDEHERQESQQKRQAWQAVKDNEAQLDAMLDEVTATVNAYIGALLLINNFHQHKRQWRKKRE